MIHKLKALAQALVGGPAASRTIMACRRTLHAILSKTWLLRGVYQAFASSNFYFEHLAVSAGIAKYNRGLSSTSPRLRRNVHRLEKGLTSRHRRSSFARDYVLETVRELADRTHELDPVERNWAMGVLKEYFASVDHDTLIDLAEEEFNTSIATLPQSHVLDLHGPMLKKTGKPVPYEKFMELSVQRRSVRWFTDKPVKPADFKMAVEAALLSPSSCNRLPFRIIAGYGTIEAPRIVGLPFGAAGFGGQVPLGVAIIGDFSSYFSVRDRHGPYIDAGLFGMSLSLALETLGLSSTIINWPEVAPQDMIAKRRFRLKSHERVIFMMAIGYADVDVLVPSSAKKSVEHMISELR